LAKESNMFKYFAGAVPLLTVKMERRSSEGAKTWQHLVVDGIQPEGKAMSILLGFAVGS